MHFRQATEEHVLGLELFSSTIWQGHDVMGRPGLHGPGSLLAVDHGTIVGAATAQMGRAEGAPATVHVDVAPTHRRRRIGSELLDRLLDSYPGRLWIGRALRSQAGALEFAQVHGFAEVERALEGWIDPRPAADSLKWASEAAGIAVRPPVESEVPVAALVIGDGYRRTHAWNPPAPFTPEEARRIFLSNAIDPSLFVTVVDGEIVGSACLSKPPGGSSDGTAWLVWAAARPGSPKWVVPALVGSVLGKAADLGLRVRVEVNNHNTDLWVVVDDLPGAELQQDLVVLTKAG